MTWIRDHDPPLWRIIVTSLTGTTLTCLDGRATGRQFLFTLNGPAQHTGQVATDDVEINLPWPTIDDPALLSQYTRLIYGFRRERGALPPWVCRFGGIIEPVEDEVADAPTARYTAYDPWRYLMDRPARNPDTTGLLKEDGYTYPKGTLASDIAVEQFALTAAADGETHIDASDGGLIEDSDPLPDPFPIEQATSVGEVWQNLCDTGYMDIRLLPLYDPIAKPGKVVQLEISKIAGSTRTGSVMAWDMGPQSIVGLSRMIDQLANKVMYYSGPAAGSVPQIDAASVAKYGPHWLQQIISSSSHPELVNVNAYTELIIRRDGKRTINFDPVPEMSRLLPLTDYALGDYVPVWASRNLREPLAVDYDAYNADPTEPGAAGYRRVYAIPIDLDDNGVERVRGIVTSQDSR